jgi:hypothetical protein
LQIASTFCPTTEDEINNKVPSTPVLAMNKSKFKKLGIMPKMMVEIPANHV